jgi:hypothetical protein
MQWIAIPDSDGTWGVLLEVEDCDGTKGFIRLLADSLSEEEARTTAHRANG